MHITHKIFTGHLGCEIDLQFLTLRESRIILRERPFKCVVWKLASLPGTLLVYPSGKACYHGMDMKVFRKYARRIQRYFPEVRIHSSKLVSMSATHKLAEKFVFEAICESFTAASYQPELFNGAYLKQDGLAYTIFHSGHVNIVGLKGEDDDDTVLLPCLN